MWRVSPGSPREGRGDRGGKDAKEQRVHEQVAECSPEVLVSSLSAFIPRVYSGTSDGRPPQGEVGKRR